MRNLSSVLAQGFYFLITSLIIIAPALYNRYPLMYFDSGAYMEMANILEPSFHRAMGYPLLMKMSGLLVSNWPIIIVQGLLLSVLLYRIILSVLGAERSYLRHFTTVCLLSFGSAMSWYAAQLMPDIFTLIITLACAAVVLEKHISVRWLSIYATIIFFGLLTHLSHIPLLLLILIGMGFLLWKSPVVLDGRKKLVTLSAPLILAILFTCSFNAYHGMGFRLSLASNAFITANLGEMGILKMYLDENCDSQPMSLCDIKDDLPKETYGYLWDPEGPVQQHPDGWAGANEEFKPIVRDFFFNVRYSKWFLFSSVKATMKQLFQIEIGSGIQYAYGEGTPPFWPMRDHFKQELNEYLISVQNKGDLLPISFFKYVNYITLFLAILIIGRAVVTRSLSPELGLLLILFLSAYFFNAAITGVLANVYERLQCRLLPLVQLTAILIWFQSSTKGIQPSKNQEL
ncbi:MAG: hypothetical protein HN542_10310 [Flavobacteriales bacterium]|jgi:hypothetical protein|nr:hypothetical protein [Flavobacteriales bacterium]MBT3964525.1 hypothetical protein [Flavobacteriales bacterium]MBT4705771.1 hypothetical protein [Flavobacteriales bacterium]MBT4930232.1 hypothetical protein [Flavobacteriales bacterium]MBT5132455.1 hypothetical protein [Flavobacteriales bacterium]